MSCFVSLQARHILHAALLKAALHTLESSCDFAVDQCRCVAMWMRWRSCAAGLPRGRRPRQALLMLCNCAGQPSEATLLMPSMF